MWRWNWLDNLVQDIRYGLRMLVKNPGFTAVAVLTLALGIGANTAIFSVVNAVLLRPLPFPNPEQLVALFERDPKVGYDQNFPAAGNYPDWYAQNNVFTQMAAYPIGRRLLLQAGNGAESRQAVEVVGLVRTGKYRTLSEEPRPFLYRPILQNYHSRFTMVVRAAGDPHSLLPVVRREIQALDPTVVPFDLATMKEYMAFPLFPARTTGVLLAAFGFLALVLSVAGLYGVMAYAVSQRKHEIGVRMALGAAQADVMKLVIGQGMALTLIGIGIGLVGAFAATRALASLLYGIASTDFPTFATVSLVLAGVALLACYLPARRATNVDPMVALRYE